jgi:hypothetical protein
MTTAPTSNMDSRAALEQERKKRKEKFLIFTLVKYRLPRRRAEVAAVSHPSLAVRIEVVRRRQLQQSTRSNNTP